MGIISTAVKGKRPGCGVGAAGGREPGRQSGRSEGSRASEGRPGEGWASYFCHTPPPHPNPPRVSRCASPAQRRPLCASNMICNFRQTFEVPDICIMWASLLATGTAVWHFQD